MTLADLSSRLKGCVVKSDTVLTALCPCCSKAMTVREENGEIRFKCYGRHCGQTEIEQALSEGGGNSEIPRRDVASITSGTSVAAPQADDGWSGASQSEDKGGGRHDGQSERIGRTASVEEDRPDVAAAPVESAWPGPSKPRSGSQTNGGAPASPPQWEVDLYHLARGMVHSADTVYTIDELKFALEYAAFSRPDPRFKGSWHPEGMAEGTVKERIAELVDAAIDEEAFDKGPRRHPPHFDWGKEREPGEETETGANESGNATGKSDGASAKAKTEDIWDEEEPDEEEEPPEALTVGQLYGLLEEWEKQPWVWDGILPHSSLSLLTGKAETGKSTLLYALIFAVARGLPFLGRQCEQGSVLYLAGDPASEIVAGRTFRGLGISPQEPIMVLPGALAASPNGIRILRQTVEKLKPILIIGDTLASVVVLDVDKYGQSQGAQQPLVKVARKWKPNFLVSHHSQKSAVDSYGVVDSALGSVGVAAVASTRMATKKRRKLGADYYTFEMSNLRIGTPIQGEWIVRKMDNCLLELDGLWAAKQVECDRETILKELRERSEPVTKSLLWREMRIRPKYGEFAETLRMLVKEGWVLERPSGKTGGGSVYSMNQGGRQSNDL